jgi:hypothetical protein
MEPTKKITLLGKEIGSDDIEQLESPALKEILKQQLENYKGETTERCAHYSVYSRYSKSTCICLPLVGL